MCIDGSVVEFSPATREARVRFPVNASYFASFFSTSVNILHIFSLQINFVLLLFLLVVNPERIKDLETGLCG